MTDLAFGAGHGQHTLGTFENRKFGGISDVYWLVLGRLGQAHDAFDLIADVAEAASLAAIAIYGELFAAQCLLHEVGYDTPVVELHPGTIGVEDAQNAGVHLVIPVIGHGGGFREALGLVVH